VRLSDGGIQRISSVRSEVDILSDLARRLLPDSPIDFAAFQHHGKVREAIAQVVPGMEELADIDVAKREFHIRGRVLHSPEFHTASGKAHFAIPALQAQDDLDLPFTLLSIRSEGQFNSIIYEQADSYRGVEDRWSALMNQCDVLELGLSEGDQVDIRSATGEMKSLRIKVFDLPRGNVAVYYPEANCLTTRQCDPRSHTPQFKSVPVAVEVSTSRG